MNTSSHTPGVMSESIQRATFVAFTFVEEQIAAIHHRYNFRKTVAALNALDDRELADIGIVRSDIKTVAKQQHS